MLRGAAAHMSESTDYFNSPIKKLVLVGKVNLLILYPLRNFMLLLVLGLRPTRPAPIVEHNLLLLTAKNLINSTSSNVYSKC